MLGRKSGKQAQTLSCSQAKGSFVSPSSLGVEMGVTDQTGLLWEVQVGVCPLSSFSSICDSLGLALNGNLIISVLGEGARGHILALGAHSAAVLSGPEALYLSLSLFWAHSQVHPTFRFPRVATYTISGLIRTQMRPPNL